MGNFEHISTHSYKHIEELAYRNEGRVYCRFHWTGFVVWLGGVYISSKVF